MNEQGTRLDQWVATATEIVDLGWGWASFHEQGDAITVTRTCKGCGVSVTSPGHREGEVLRVEPRPFEHGDHCPMLRRIARGEGQAD
jgi:hypothetical protein